MKDERREGSGDGSAGTKKTGKRKEERGKMKGEKGVAMVVPVLKKEERGKRKDERREGSGDGSAGTEKEKEER